MSQTVQEQNQLIGALLTAPGLLAAVFACVLPDIEAAHAELLPAFEAAIEDSVPRLTSEPDPEFERIRAAAKESLLNNCLAFVEQLTLGAALLARSMVAQCQADEIAAAKVAAAAQSDYEQ
jgi:hypothetical protein